MSAHSDPVALPGKRHNSRFNLMLQYSWCSLDSSRASLVKGVTSPPKHSPKSRPGGPLLLFPPRLWTASCPRKGRSCPFYSASCCAHLALPHYSNRQSFTQSVSGALTSTGVSYCYKAQRGGMWPLWGLGTGQGIQLQEKDLVSY